MPYIKEDSERTGKVLVDVLEERARQDEQWAVDDTRTPVDWDNYREKQMIQFRFAFARGEHKIAREHLVKAAALLVAQIEALDRI